MRGHDIARASALVGALIGGCSEAETDDPWSTWGAAPGLGDGEVTGDDGEGSDEGTSGGPTSADGSGDGSSGSAGDEPDEPWEPDPNGPAFLHADVWSVFWNDRTRCGAERTFLEICERRGDADCTAYQAAYAACDPWMVVYGQVGPEQQGNELCARGPLPDVGGCVAAQYDFDALRFSWYGAEWQGNWPFATLKVFPAGADWTGGGEIVALSNLPGHAQAAMAGIDDHGLGWGCTMHGATSGDAAYRSPFGAFAWVEVPTGAPVIVAAAAGTNFGDQPFQGCQRGAATQEPWVSDAPGSTLGCVYVQEVTFEPGHHYAWRYGTIVELDQPRPPAEILAGFARPEVGLDVSEPDACAL
jgi:hypothetical protein